MTKSCVFLFVYNMKSHTNISEVCDWTLTFSSTVIHIKCLPCGTWLKDHGSIYEVEFSRRFRRNSFWSCLEDTRSYIMWLLAPKMSGVFNSKIFGVYRFYRCFLTLGSSFDGKNQYWYSGWNLWANISLFLGTLHPFVTIWTFGQIPFAFYVWNIAHFDRNHVKSLRGRRIRIVRVTI